MPYRDIEQRRAYGREHYRRNRATYKARARIFTDTARAELRQELLRYLESHACVDCGESDPVVLEFDHRDARTKSFSVGSVMQRGYSWASVVKEIEKCDVRCANCHRRRTAVQLGWYKSARGREAGISLAS